MMSSFKMVLDSPPERKVNFPPKYLRLGLGEKSRYASDSQGGERKGEDRN